MSFNLIDERWIPVRRRSGRVECIAPWEIVGRGDDGDRPVTFAACRPDFNGALAQFLIGLLQTCMPSRSDDAWARALCRPPSQEELRKAFGRYRYAFDLDGDGPRFLQDMDASLSDKDERIDKLLIDGPSVDISEYFHKATDEPAFTLATAACALFALQTYGPGGGRGHRTGLRGGGPLTTLNLGADLWQTLWLNVVCANTIEAMFAGDDVSRLGADDIFPWLAATRTSERGETTSPADVHPLQMYWGMPKRIRLQLGDGELCSLSGERSPRLALGTTLRHGGINYEGPWKHPLTPYRRDKEALISLKGTKSGIGYQHWLGIVASEPTGQREPALVVRRLRELVADAVVDVEDFGGRQQIWAFGYDMSNAKAQAWCEAMLPSFPVRKDILERFDSESAPLIHGAEFVASTLRQALRRALYGKPKKVGRKTNWGRFDAAAGATLFVNAEQTFWRRTEPSFYECVADTAGALEANADHSELHRIRERWLEELCQASRALFDETITIASFAATDVRAIVQARRELEQFTARWAKPVCKRLRLPQPAKKHGKAHVE